VDSAPLVDTVPVTLLTGFLGSGKTTLLRRVLSAPEFSDTAVVINEAGEISIDHYLIDFVEGEVVELPSGCLCCAVREDLAASLRGLIERRDAGDIRRFRRMVIETSGLADPTPILFTLGTDPMLDHRLRLGRVVTLVDAVTGAETLARFAEAARQAAVADALVISKTDLAPLSPQLGDRLDALNPTARRIAAAEMAKPAEVLFGPASRYPRESGGPATGDRAVARVSRFRGDPTSSEHTHSHGIAAFAIMLHQPPGRFEFARALGGLAQDRGYDLLRVKGLVAFADQPDRPAVIQAAQHAMFAPEWLDEWPDADRRSRLVFIVHDIRPQEILDRFAFAAPTLLQERGPGEGLDPFDHTPAS
jgi:G3E family GTPase